MESIAGIACTVADFNHSTLRFGQHVSMDRLCTFASSILLLVGRASSWMAVHTNFDKIPIDSNRFHSKAEGIYGSPPISQEALEALVLDKC